MVKTIHLIRHGHHALLGRQLCGRMSGVVLDELGCRQMELCATLLPSSPSAVQSSPQPRARQSAAILAWRFGVAVEIVKAVDEIDVGDWAGRTFEELGQDPRWARWNSARASSRPPKGETMAALQGRVVAHLEQLRHDGSDRSLLVVSHAKPIRAALLYYLDRSLDDFLAIDVDPGSISTLAVDRAGIHVSTINQKVAA